MADLGLPEISSATGATVQDQAYERLRNAVMVGALRPGTALGARDIFALSAAIESDIRDGLIRLGRKLLKMPDMALPPSSGTHPCQQGCDSLFTPNPSS